MVVSLGVVGRSMGEGKGEESTPLTVRVREAVAQEERGGFEFDSPHGLMTAEMCARTITYWFLI